MKPLVHTDDLHLLLATLPPALQEAVQPLQLQELLEIVLDLGRPPAVRFPGKTLILQERPVDRDTLRHVVDAVGRFGGDNRAGIEGTLHRISAIRNRNGEIVGLTLRVGRAVFGTIDQIRDLVQQGRSLLLLGPPGVGKTTKLREVARVLADDFGRRVIVIDTSNEIAGDGDVPHPAIGSARRMQVPRPEQQHAVMIEAVENHMPEVVIIDEIGSAAEAQAARTIAERGVQLIGTAHGNTLENLVMNPTLSDLVGGTQTVTLGDEEARLRGTQKTITERRAPPTFPAVVEILDRERVRVHPDTGAAVDRLLQGRDPGGQIRGEAFQAPPTPAPARPPSEPRPQAAVPEERERTIRIFPYAVSRDLVERVIRSLRLDARTVSRPDRADFIIALRSRAGDYRLNRIVEATGIPVLELKKGTTAQIRRLLQSAMNVGYGLDDEQAQEAAQEAEEAIRRVIAQGGSVALPPRPGPLRELQHRLAVRHHLVAESVGSEPQRHLIIHA